MLREQDGRWHLIIAGREYDFSLESLDREVRRRDLGDGTVTLEASPSDQRLSELMGQASYFLCLSRHEGFGLAAIEAMSAGLTPVRWQSICSTCMTRDRSLIRSAATAR